MIKKKTPKKREYSYRGYLIYWQSYSYGGGWKIFGREMAPETSVEKCKKLARSFINERKNSK